MFLGATLLTAGCGGGGGDGAERAVEWSVDRPVGLRWVRLAATTEWCWSPEAPLLEEPIVEYSGNRVYIELRRTPEESEGEHKGCLLQLLVAFKKITLERDLDELVLYDASTDPPEQRWPRQR
jgi:hypothetical protein